MARPGTKVEVTSWRAQIRYVDFVSARRYTNADVRGDYRTPLALGLGIALFGVAAVLGTLATRWSSRRTAKAYPWQAGLTATGGVGLVILGAAAPWTTHDVGGALRLIGLGAPVILAVCATAAPVLWWRERGDDTITMKPAILTEEVCVPGIIVGDVPYAGDLGFLAAAPGTLATTPDPTGVFHRKEVPSTLAPLRLRPPYRADNPEGPAVDSRSLVLECEDGGVRVLVVAREKDMPVVLGALGSLRSAPESPSRTTGTRSR